MRAHIDTVTDDELRGLGPASTAFAHQGRANGHAHDDEEDTVEQLPLYPPLPPSEPYPVEAMPPILAGAVRGIARKVQVPPALAAQSVLAVASLAAQAHADVLLPFGQARPLSLILATIAASGDRKSSSDNEALWPVRKIEASLKAVYDRDRETWAISAAAWGAERRRIEGDKGLDYEGRKQALTELGSEPAPPLYPFKTMPDPTVEGLAKAWISAEASLGLFSAEGGSFVGGHGMNADNRLKSAATFSEIWDGKPIRRVRAADGVSILPGRRLATHLMIQPNAATLFLADDVLRDQGLLSRVLVAAPDTLAGSRLYREPHPDDEAAIRAYGARLLDIMETPALMAPGTRNELDPRKLPMTDEAAGYWRAFFDHVEVQCGQSGELRGIRDFAAKAAEQAGRLAGIFAIVGDVHAREISGAMMKSAIVLTDWYVTEATRLQKSARTDPKLLRAQALLEWISGQGNRDIEFRDVLRLGPSATRTKDEAEKALGVLKAHGWIKEPTGRPRRIRLIKRGAQA